MTGTDIGVLLVLIGLTIYGFLQFVRGYKYNSRLLEEDKETGNYVNGNGSMLDEFFRIAVPHLPLKVARYFKMILGIFLMFLGGGLVIAFISDFFK